METITLVTIIAPFAFNDAKDRRAFASNADAHEWAARRIEYFNQKEEEKSGDVGMWKHEATFDTVIYVEADE